MDGRGGVVDATEHTTEKGKIYFQSFFASLPPCFLFKCSFIPFTCLVELQEQVQELRRLQLLEEVWESELQEARNR